MFQSLIGIQGNSEYTGEAATKSFMFQSLIGIQGNSEATTAKKAIANKN